MQIEKSRIFTCIDIVLKHKLINTIFKPLLKRKGKFNGAMFQKCMQLNKCDEAG